MNPLKLRIYASHHFFYVQDSQARADDPDFWTQQAADDKMAVTEGALGIGTGTYGYVKVKAEGFERQPRLDLAKWDHIAEASLNHRA